MAASKVIFLDRDGTINVDHDEWWKVERFEFHKRAPEALKLLKDRGYTLALITNQGAIERGLYTEEEVISLHRHMQKLLGERGAELDAIAYCPHYSKTNCNCRKPKVGMAKSLEKEIGEIDYGASWTIGDKPTDVGFGRNVGTKTALIRSEYWNEAGLSERPDLIVDSLWEAAEKIVGSGHGSV